MNRTRLLKLLAFFLGLSLTPSLARAQSENYLSQIFTEKVLTVTREGDGIFPGTLRALLIQASGIRAQNPFTVVRIVFDPTVKRVRVTKGSLPEISGSLTTLDCQTAQGRGLIEGVQENTEGIDPAEEIAGLKLTSNGNTVRNCHITGFRGPGILIRGNRNTVEYDTIGYHKDVPETAIDPSPLFGEPKTNQGSGIFIGDGSSENVVQNNDIVANTFNGVEFSGGVGAANKIVYNFFAKNSGRPIKVAASANASRQPQITKIQQQGDLYLISGVAEPHANLQIYAVGKDDTEVGMVIIPGAQTTQDTFTVATKSKGFVPNQTKIVALAQGSNHNTSEFSGAIIIPGPNATTIGAPDGDSTSAPKIEVEAPPKDEATNKGESSEGGSNGGEPNNAEGNKPAGADAATPANTNSNIVTPAIVTSPSAPQAKAPDKPSEPETTINLNGAGEPGHEPDSGSMSDKSAKISALGI